MPPTVGQRRSPIDIRTYTPENSLEFQCTFDLKGRLYLLPGMPDVYLLDFIDNNGTRRNVTNLHIYPYYYPARGRPDPELEPMGSMDGRRATIDIFTVPPGFEYEICDALHQRLKWLSFTYRNKILEPILND